MDFSLYNTLSGTKEKFIPLRGNRVDFYSCGPTVYNRIHIGNIRSFLCADTLYRWLRYGMSYEVRWVMNITDIDDKTIRGSQQDFPNLAPLEALQKFTHGYEEAFFEDLDKIHISKGSFYRTPRATESIDGMQELIRSIADNGYAYEKDGSVYFAVEKYSQAKKYGQLVDIDLTMLKTGTRTLADEIDKENVQDFVLWKGQKPGEPIWEFFFQGKSIPGRPGWHIECSAMEKEVFEELPFDIHSGGVDLKFPHHEDEIAQSAAGYGMEPARFWVHNEHLMVQGQKMSKSLGNFYTLDDLLQKGHSAEAIRFFLVSNHYRTKLNLTDQSLQAAANTLQHLRNGVKELGISAGKDIYLLQSSDLSREFLAAWSDDLNVSPAIAVLFEALRSSALTLEEKASIFTRAEQLFGLSFLSRDVIIPQHILELARSRDEEKSKKNFLEADRLRQEILTQGYEIRDTPEGAKLSPKVL